MTEKTNHDLYEKFSGLYELLFKPFFIGAIIKTIEHLKRKSVQDVLEVGVGTGYSLEHYPKEAEVTAIDISQKMVEMSLDKISRLKNKKIKVFTSEHFKKTNLKLYSTVVSFSVITVVPDGKAFLNELASYCKPGGFVYIIMHKRGKGIFWLLDVLLHIPCQFLFGFSLMRNLEDYELEGLEVVEQKVVSRLLFYPYNHLIVLKKKER